MLLRSFPACLLALLACTSSAPPPGWATPQGTDQDPVADAAVPADAFDPTHAAWTAILRANLHGDRFDYAAVKKDPEPLHAYLRTLEAVTLPQMKAWSRAQRFAFWIDAYNAYTIEKVVESYPIGSIRDLSGLLGVESVFDDPFIPLAALYPESGHEKLSLNDIEHGILRAGFQDARVHAAINCASVSCPPLRPEAFTAEHLDDQLDAQMRAFLAGPGRNRYDHDKNLLWLSRIFQWFSADFERDAGSVRAFVARYAPEAERSFVPKATVQFLDYDWDLNDVPHEDAKD